MTALLVPAMAILAGTTSGCGAGQDVSGYVGTAFTRATSRDDGTARAFTAPGDRHAVASRIAAAVRPLDRLDAATASYLQYRNAIVRIDPDGGGSVVRVDTYGNGYRRWVGDIAPRWGALPPDDDLDGK